MNNFLVLFLSLTSMFFSSNLTIPNSIGSSLETLDCSCNDPCVSMAWNSTSECLTFSDIGTNCSPVSSSVTQWKNDLGTYVNIPSSGEICGCDVYEYLEVAPICNVEGDKFVIGGTNFQKCAGRCVSRVDFTFPQGSSNITAYPACSQTLSCVEITPLNLMNNGGSMTAYFRSDTPFGSVVTIVRYTYNGGGLNCSNITSQIIQRGKIYKDIWAKRTVTYSDACPSVICEYELDLPQLPDNCLLELFVNTVNVGAPCSGMGFGASTINLTTPATYQWSYNGTNIAENYTPSIYCLVGKPYGTYCVSVADASGCMAQACRLYQVGCTLGVTINKTGNILTANLTNCVGSPSYQWAKWNGTAWINIGTNASTYNTTGLPGDFRVTVSCNSCVTQGSIVIIPPCATNISITNSPTYLTANFTGCTGGPYTYTWEKQVTTTIWEVVQTNTTNFTSDIYSPSFSGMYRVTGNCGFCTNQIQTSWSPVPPISPLPLELSSFKAYGKDCSDVILKWKTAQERNNDFFEILRSEDAEKYVSIAKVKGKNQNTSAEYEFSDTDHLENGHKYFYKLKQVDFDGKVNKYHPISIVYNCGLPIIPQISLSPNPALDLLSINFSGFDNTKVSTYRIRNSSGIIIRQSNILPTGKLEINLEQFSPGIYLLEIQDSNILISKKFVKI